MFLFVSGERFMQRLTHGGNLNRSSASCILLFNSEVESAVLWKQHSFSMMRSCRNIV